MSNPKFVSVACAIIVCISSIASFAADAQQWSVQLNDDTAVLRASKDTRYEFVKATITALQDAGTEKFALRVMEPADKTERAKLTYSINIVDGTAEITASTDLPYKYLETIISQLKDCGVTKMKFTAHGKATGEAAPASQQ